MNDMERFWKHTAPSDSGCILWQGGTAWGYGVFWFDNSSHRAHRFIYEQSHGPIPNGLVIDHLCGNRGCVNIDHLEAVSQQINTQRRSRRIIDGREGACVNGHGPEHMVLYEYAYGVARRCRICGNARAEQSRRRRGAQIRDSRLRDSCMKRGHPWPANLRYGPDGKAYCVACARERARERRAATAKR